MTRCEVVVWKKGRKYGKPKLFPSFAKAENFIKKEKKDPKFKGYSMMEVRPEYYRKKMGEVV